MNKQFELIRKEMKENMREIKDNMKQYEEKDYKVIIKYLDGNQGFIDYDTLKECYEYINKSTTNALGNNKTDIIGYEIRYKNDTRMIDEFYNESIDMVSELNRDLRAKYINLKLIYNYEDELIQDIMSEIKSLSDNIENKFKDIIRLLYNSKGKVENIITDNLEKQIKGE